MKPPPGIHANAALQRQPFRDLRNAQCLHRVVRVRDSMLTQGAHIAPCKDSRVYSSSTLAMHHHNSSRKPRLVTVRFTRLQGLSIKLQHPLPSSHLACTTCLKNLNCMDLIKPQTSPPQALKYCWLGVHNGNWHWPFPFQDVPRHDMKISRHHLGARRCPLFRGGDAVDLIGLQRHITQTEDLKMA